MNITHYEEYDDDFCIISIVCLITSSIFLNKKKHVLLE